jgi:hypothetical protein
MEIARLESNEVMATAIPQPGWTGGSKMALGSSFRIFRGGEENRKAIGGRKATRKVGPGVCGKVRSALRY